MKPYYEQDGIKIYHGDNCDVMGEMPRESVDLVVTSPPYDDLRTYGGHSWDFYGVAWQLKRIIKPGGVIVWIMADATKDGSETGTSMEQALHFKRLGLNLHDTMIYEKAGVSFPETTRYYPIFEFMFVFSLGRPRTCNLLHDRPNIWAGQKVHSTMRNSDGTLQPKACIGNVTDTTGIRYNIWRIPHNLPGRAAHPATFPEALARDHILSWSNPGDTVLDPFCGSGTTMKMAKELGRIGIGAEINQEYCEVAAKRLAQGVLFGAAS